jgi:hypothetical protein
LEARAPEATITFLSEADMTPLLVFVWLIAPSMRHTDVVSNITLTVAIGASADVSREIQEAALIETAKIWAPYGVTISMLAASNHIVQDVVVVAAPNRGTREVSHALAWVPLAPEHTPMPVVYVRYRGLLDLVGDTHVITPFSEYPPGLRDQFLARALGRVIAHELGHILLQSVEHDVGLMRPVQDGRELLSPDRATFWLSAPDLARLRANIHAAAAAGASPCR